ncbi:MAG: FtsX-like permease family protein [Mycobacteriaceae bacterium]
MGLIAWRNIMGHKARTAFLALCVVIGVSFVAGTFVLTDTMKHVFTQIFDDAYSGVSVSVRSQSDLGAAAARPAVPDTVLKSVRGVPGIRVAEGNVFSTGGRIIDGKGKQVGNQFAPTFLASWSTVPDFNSFTIVRGVPPTAAGEVVVDLGAATSAGFKVGDDVRVQTARGLQRFHLVGIARYGKASNMGGASAALFDLPTAQREAGRVGAYDNIDVAAADGVETRTLQSSVQAAIGPRFEAVTGADLSVESADAINSGLAFFATFLLVFAAVSLFVGAFIVYNTFAIVVAQRTREMALLRALGAGGAQVIGSVLLESLIIGLVASAVGLLGGVGMALALKGLLAVIGFDVPTGSLVVLPRTILVSIAGGVLVTMVAAIAPAWRASRVPPLAAIRTLDRPTRAQQRWTLGAGLILLLAGVALVIFGASSASMLWLGLGAVLSVLAVALLAPSIVAPFVSAAVAPLLRLRGVSGQLAEENASRNARRTATTATALMIGSALIAASLVLASSINTSTDKALDRGLKADLIVSAGGNAGVGPSVADTLRHTDGVASVAAYRFGAFKVGTSTQNVAAMAGSSLDPTSATAVLDLDVVRGSIAAIDRGGIAVSQRVAADHGWQIGDSVNAVFATGPHPLRIEAIYTTTSFGDYLISLATHAKVFADSTDVVAFVRIDDAAALTSVQAHIADILAKTAPAAKVQNRTEYAGALRAQVNQLLSLITALVLLAVVIALLGVLITMLLSVLERTHELGLLRAIGMDRSGIRSMVRWEAAIIATFGALLGMLLGVSLGYALTRTLRDQGISTLAVPYRTLALVVVLVAISGVVASIYPARRAARLNVLQAIASE